MALVDLDLARGYLRVDPGSDDATIEVLLDGAQQRAVDYLNRQVFEDDATLAAAVGLGTAGEFPMVVNGAIKAAILKTLGELYANREETVFGGTLTQLSVNAESLLRAHRIVQGL